jgi:glycerate kinase
VLAAAKRLGIPVVALGGRVECESELLAGGFHAVRTITPHDQSTDVAMQRETAMANMERTARALAHEIISQ